MICTQLHRTQLLPMLQLLLQHNVYTIVTYTLHDQYKTWLSFFQFQKNLHIYMLADRSIFFFFFSIFYLFSWERPTKWVCTTKKFIEDSGESERRGKSQ